MSAILMLLALQGDPVLERIEPLTGDLRRPLHWTLLKVTLSSRSGFDGRVEAESSFNFRTAVPLKLAPGGRGTVYLPALDPESVSAGASRRALPRPSGRAERLLIAREGVPLPPEAELPPDLHLRRLSREDGDALLPWGAPLFEAADLGWLGPGAAPETAAEAKDLLSRPLREPLRFSAVDPAVWTRMPDPGWMASKRSGLVFLAIVYAGLALGAAAAWSRLPGRAKGPIAVGLPLLLLALSFELVPGGELSATAQSVTARDGTRSWSGRVWYLSAGLDGRYVVDFPRPVKPVFPTAAGAETPFVLVFEGGRSRAEGLRLGPGKRACFGTSEAPAAPPPASRLDEVKLSGGVAEPAERGRLPDLEVWGRWLDGEGVFSYLAPKESPGTDLRGVELGEGTERRAILLERRGP